MKEEHIVDLSSQLTLTTISYENYLMEGKFNFGHKREIKGFNHMLSTN
jgi:hypothetical protein